MTGVKVSVLVPVYNVERQLPKCADSILSQTLKDIELIFVDDASTDGSLSVCLNYADKDKRVMVISKKKNEGLMMARKTGYSSASGEYVFFCDSDDYLPYNALELLYDKILCDKSDIAVGEIYLRNGEGQLVRKSRHSKIGNSWESYLKSILNWTTCSLCGSLYRREIFTEREYVTFENCNYSEDRILLTQILMEYKPRITSINDVTYYYCLNSLSLTRSRLSNEELNAQLTALVWCHDYVERYMSDREFHIYNNRFLCRYLSLYIERGYDVNFIKACAPINETILERKKLFQALGLRLGIHTWMCMNLPIYRSLAYGCRLLIRKIQGKD